MFGKGQLSKEAIKEFVSIQYFLPVNKNDCMSQLKIMIRFLEVICSKRSIATSWYYHGLGILLKEGWNEDKVAREKKTFLTKFIYLLDCAFQ